MSEYCDSAPGHAFHGPYHEHEYGFPVSDESELFERLVLEINQAGLSWLTVLKKRSAFRLAFDHFDVDLVAAYGDKQRQRLLNDAGIIRNRLKVDAVIHNAQVIRDMRDSHGGFSGWIEAHHPRTHAEWVKLFKRTFRFTGPEIVNEFLMSTGYLPGAHRDDCPVQQRIVAARPAWLRNR
ncbi:DNA-3-methyladenine glycosylase I [Halomonas cupida]|uniref:DNA-3-methyladenine glycosylase I n=1 Tax=Halomonas cupida TaxID=44933 RepID=A0A1M7IXS3_9GAMM|nr:DNA-3-methyladenine glycosylase I [Halomonas cupida]GEN24230.1 DNA-3-methyladenine glycosylase I [Halomonas cupida]SHM45498.1 DNA-3-methyladenine glycosylase I [Halomonas cupida]